MLFAVAQMVKNPPAMQGTQVQSLRWEDPLEEEMATQSSVLAQGVLWTEEPGGLQSMGHKESDMTERLVHTHTHTAQQEKKCSDVFWENQMTRLHH